MFAPLFYHQREAHEREMAEQFRLEQIRKEQEEEREVGHNFRKLIKKLGCISTVFDTQAVNISYNYVFFSQIHFKKVIKKLVCI
jgi:hypothetical protein